MNKRRNAYPLSGGVEYRVKVTPGIKKESVRLGRDGRFLVFVSAPREEGKANERMRELLARHFGVSRDRVIIRRGHTSSTKTVFVKQKGG
ncbi:MAG: DUF167 domain-containing protein [bacterium]|nr:DUF167 domain-containing protein [bacterium]